jgi:Carboxypeptidase regulatory-like domain
MKKSLVLLGISGLLAAVFFSCSDKGTGSNSNETKIILSSISGTVTDSVTGFAIPNAMVSLLSIGGPVLDSSVTDIDGAYALLNVKTGSSPTLRIQANGFITKNATVAVVDTTALTINVKLVLAIDQTVVGKWQGAIGAIKIPNTINFNGEKIFVNISGNDSTFALITRDTTRAATPLISDTTLVLAGSWRLNAPKDSALLLCDTCRIIDTTLNTLVPRLVKGQTIPVFINIARNTADGYIEWQISLTDFLPIAPLMGLNLNGVNPTLFSGTIIVLAKMSEE